MTDNVSEDRVAPRRTPGRIQLRNRWRDFLDKRARRGWYAPIGTYDGVEGGRPFRHLRCHICGGAHFADGHR